jgi:mono/diheme cytochrome c family protein
MLRRVGILILVVVAGVQSAYLAYPVVRDLIAPPNASDSQRGRELASRLGCFSCHGPNGTGGVPNPGSELDEVPSFHEGTIMMYAKDDQELREYILDGAPAKKRARPTYEAEMAKQAIRMPAYRGFVSDAEVELLVTYLRATSGLLEPPAEPALRGAELVAANGCFTCHGELGSGGVPNPGSLKGYIPGFSGPDFEELVQNDDELRSWIADGGIPRLRNDQVASFFLERQRIQMPAYREHLKPEEIDALVAYVRWTAGGTWRTMPLSE